MHRVEIGFFVSACGNRFIITATTRHGHSQYSFGEAAYVFRTVLYFELSNKCKPHHIDLC